jgi:hypothetical protein
MCAPRVVDPLNPITRKSARMQAPSYIMSRTSPSLIDLEDLNRLSRRTRAHLAAADIARCKQRKKGLDTNGGGRKKRCRAPNFSGPDTAFIDETTNA